MNKFIKIINSITFVSDDEEKLLDKQIDSYFDSLDVVEMALELEHEYDIVIEDDELLDLDTFREVYELVLRKVE